MNQTLKAVISSLCIILVLVILVVVLLPKAEMMKVSELSWTRRIEIEEYKTISESGWNLPAGARIIYKGREIKSYIKVLDHYETQTANPNSPTISAEQGEKKIPVYRNDPVYATKYYYTIERWKYARTEVVSGLNDEPYWPELSLSDKEREGKRTQNYSVKLYSTLDGKKTEKSYSISYDLWQQLKLNDEIIITVSNGRITSIERK